MEEGDRLNEVDETAQCGPDQVGKDGVKSDNPQSEHLEEKSESASLLNQEDKTETVDHNEVMVTGDSHSENKEESETSSLLNQDETGNVDHDGVILNEPTPCLDHPLRALSVMSLDRGDRESGFGCASIATQPQVYVSVPNSTDPSSMQEHQRKKRKISAECVPLRAIFHSNAALSESQREQESPFGYKNWLLHLGRRRRCELLILVGFLLWLGFFLVLAIVLNGNAGRNPDKGSDKESPWENSNHDVIFVDKTNHSGRITETPKDDKNNNSVTSKNGKNHSGNIAETETDKKVSVIFVDKKNPPETKSEETAMPATDKKANYLIGVGRADITGPAADINMMGYANPSQRSGGIHTRQYARAFIVEDPETHVRTVFVNIDACMSSTLVKLETLKLLKEEYDDLYSAENVCISGTHTHSTPAGFLQDVLFQISSYGYIEETLVAYVRGIVESIRIAHNAMQPGYILSNKGELVGSNINRSPLAYVNNPPEEKSKYKYDVDTEMFLLKFMNEKDEGIGMINWFPVHCTSMNNTNSLISGDNKGYAELLFEQFMNPHDLPGTGDFIAAFAQSNEGDVSPNTNGPHCMNTGDPCDNIHSTCDGNARECVASGPGKDMFESTKIIGKNQFEKAKELYLTAQVKLWGPVKFIHQYINMTKYEVALNESTKIYTCKPAMGFSFAAGTTDGPGAFDFKQGDRSGNTFWQIVRNFLHSPSEEQEKCHAPKPILLDTGEMTSPYEWQPEIVDTQIIQIGQLVILAVPGEFSTMAGRRLRNGVLETYEKYHPEMEYDVVIAGLANTYSDYITTYEEYQIQRYEGASTIYGPYTAKAYKQQYEKLAKNLIDGIKTRSLVRPPNNKDKLYSFQTGVYFDRAPMLKDFGDVLDDVKPSYLPGEEVSVKFVGANPRNSLTMQAGNMTFLTIEKLALDLSWEVVHTDADWETKFIWIRTSTPLATSDVIITWETEKTTPPGKYRINHYGYYKYYFGGIYAYEGRSSTFTIRSV